MFKIPDYTKMVHASVDCDKCKWLCRQTEKHKSPSTGKAPTMVDCGIVAGIFHVLLGFNHFPISKSWYVGVEAMAKGTAFNLRLLRGRSAVGQLISKNPSSFRERHKSYYGQVSLFESPVLHVDVSPSGEIGHWKIHPLSLFSSWGVTPRLWQQIPHGRIMGYRPARWS